MLNRYIENLVREAQGVPVKELVEKELKKGLDAVGKKYEAGEYFEILFD